MLTDKWCVITGASRGIGREIVKRYINKSDKIYAIARDKEKLNELAQKTDKIIPVVLDLADIEKTREYFKNLDENK